MAEENIPSTSAQAKALGVDRFFTGKPCKNGHLSKRYLAGACVACQRMFDKRYRAIPDKLATKREQENQRNRTEKRRAQKRKNRLARLVDVAGNCPPDKCEICGSPPRYRKRLAFDHCHTTGKFRGWLCERCNSVLGYVKDNSELLRSLATYLDRNVHRGQIDWVEKVTIENLLNNH